MSCTPIAQLPTTHAETSRQTIRLAERLQVRTVINFSGRPGDCDNSKYPNLVRTSWPPDNLEMLKWQFQTVGYGHDYLISIEQEDSLMSVDEGLDKATRFLNQ